MDEGELNGGGNDRQGKVDPIASASVEVSPIGYKANADLESQNYGRDSFGII